MEYLWMYLPRYQCHLVLLGYLHVYALAGAFLRVVEFNDSFLFFIYYREILAKKQKT